MNAQKIYEWGKAAAVVAGLVSSAFVVASGALQKISAIPGIIDKQNAQQREQDEMKGELRFIVRYVEEQTGKKFRPAPASSR